MANRKLGKYEIIERLGRGGMAEVYKGYHASLDRYVAIKILHTFLADAPEFKTRFEKEAQSVARLKHPHIVQVYDFDYDPQDDSYYMVMELVEGPSLKDRLFELASKGAHFPFGEALRIMYEAADALAYAHSQNMIHRDVKPANLMLDQGQRVVLTDFGIAKILTGQQYTTTGGMVGTPAYMSPEQGMGERGDERSDIYSLGVIFYELLTGRLPFQAETPVAMIMKHVNDPIPSPLAVNPALPGAVDRIIARLLAKDSVARYQHVSEFIADLDRLRMGKAPDSEKSVSSTRPILDRSESALPKPRPRGTDDSMPTVKFTEDQLQVTGVDRVPPHRRISWRGWLASVVTILIVGLAGTLIASKSGRSGSVIALETPTSIPTTAVPTEIPVEAASTEISPTATITLTPIPTLTATPTITPTPTETATPTATYTPSITPNTTATSAYILTATVAACNYNYEIVGQVPANGNDGGPFLANTEYERQIIFLNTGTCAWEPNTALTFLDGQNFNVGPRIFIRDRVEPGASVTILFAGRLPTTGSEIPLAGTWELRTPGQKPIGEPMTISIRVYG